MKDIQAGEGRDRLHRGTFPSSQWPRYGPDVSPVGARIPHRNEPSVSLKDFVTGPLDPTLCDANYSYMDATQSLREMVRKLWSLVQCKRDVPKGHLPHGGLKLQVPGAIL